MMVFTTKAIFVYFKEEENQILEKKSYFEKHFRLEVVSRLLFQILKDDAVKVLHSIGNMQYAINMQYAGSRK